VPKLKIEEIKEEKEEEIIKEEIKEIKYFGKTKTELLKSYNISMEWETI